MDKVGDFFDDIKPLYEAKDFDKEHAAILLLGADLENEFAMFEGTVKSLTALLVAAMEERKDLSFVILKACEIFLERNAKKNAKKKDDEEDGPCD